MGLPKFEHLQPESLDEALGLLSEHGEQAKIIAGGTELLVSMKQGLLTPNYLVNLKAIPELSFIAYDEERGLRIGALTKLTTLTRSQVIQDGFSILAQAANSVAAPPLQHMGTLGGNLCLNTRCFYYNQSQFWRQGRPRCYKTGGDLCHVVKGGNRCFATYQGDMAPALIALEATVKIAKRGGERVIRLADLYTGKGKRPLALKADEMLVEVQVPVSAAAWSGEYQKLRYRGAMDFPLTGVAAVVGRDGSEACYKANVVLTAVGTGPILVEEASVLLEGQGVTDERVAQVASAAHEVARPVDNIGSDPSYRRKMVRVLTKRALVNAWERE
jgi:4-hydroxybenzoyl-CoA reductase subunit beta